MFKRYCDTVIWYHKKYTLFLSWNIFAKTKGQSISISSTYILFLTKLQKRQTQWNGFALIKNDITNFESASKIKIYSRTHKVSSGCDIVLWYHRKIRPLITCFQSGRPEESHLQSPTVPYVNLSIHTAPASHTLETSRLQADAESNPAHPSLLVDCHLLRADSSPSLQPHYRAFNTTTGWSAPFMCIDTFPLRGPHL